MMDKPINTKGVIKRLVDQAQQTARSVGKKHNPTPFGIVTQYSKGDIVVWRGYDPAILRVENDWVMPVLRKTVKDVSVKINNEYNSCHYSNLRFATPKEIAMLGDKNHLDYNDYAN